MKFFHLKKNLEKKQKYQNNLSLKGNRTKIQEYDKSVSRNCLF